ncbi:hypothetical protein CSA17_03330 [bacterium DOLJORAL78_65_58]|nr:MAG: hypothetical protein CSB20_09645 [bacterium DOLZORAL124_64_63]PIE76232.1 MAG: hypothetical protein CSA17_03330 [bacterium DOLJORAL78_65_58]
MLKRITIICILAALGLSAGSALAAFEDVAVSPRARGMGETGVAVPDGPYATYLNTAQLGDLTRNHLVASYVQPFSLSFADYYHLGVAVPLGRDKGGFGFSFSQFQVEHQDVDLLDETQLSLGYGRTLYSDVHSSIALGAALSMYHLKFGETITGLDPGNDSALGLDVGLLATVHKRTRVGVMVKNINNPQIGIDQEELAHRIVGGVSYEPYAGVITTFEIDNELGQDVQYHGGIEMLVVDNFALRAGVTTNPSKLTAGFGYQLHPVSLNYGFSTGGGTLESTHQFGLSVAWGGEAP